MNLLFFYIPLMIIISLILLFRCFQKEIEDAYNETKELDLKLEQVKTREDLEQIIEEIQQLPDKYWSKIIRQGYTMLIIKAFTMRRYIK